VNVGTPQAYNLPLANSFGGSGYYFKTQNNIVTLQCWCSGSGFKAGDIVAVLPVGFRPSRATIEVPINYNVPGVGPASASIYIRNTGNIEIVYGNTNAISFSMSCATFVAAQ